MAGVRNVIRYIQDNEPTNQHVGDLWAKVGIKDCVRAWNGTAWLCVSESFSFNNPYGYAMGGIGGGQYLSSVDRIEFPFGSGSAITSGSLSGSRYNARGCNSSNYGYMLGGGGTSITKIDRLDLPFGDGLGVGVGDLDVGVLDSGACNSSNYGFAIGGWHNVVVALSKVERITFPFDSGTATNTEVNSIGIARNECFNSSEHGYSVGGIYYLTQYINTSKVSRLTFPFDAGPAVTQSGTLLAAKNWGISFNSSHYGYHCGGINVASITNKKVIRFTFPFSAGPAIDVGDLSDNRFGGAGCNSTNYGYCMGGRTAVNKSIIDRLAFPFDSGTAINVGNLPLAKKNAGGMDGTDFVSLF